MWPNPFGDHAPSDNAVMRSLWRLTMPSNTPASRNERTRRTRTDEPRTGWEMLPDWSAWSRKQLLPTPTYPRCGDSGGAGPWAMHCR